MPSLTEYGSANTRVRLSDWQVLTGGRPERNGPEFQARNLQKPPRGSAPLAPPATGKRVVRATTRFDPSEQGAQMQTKEMFAQEGAERKRKREAAEEAYDSIKGRQFKTIEELVEYLAPLRNSNCITSVQFHHLCFCWWAQLSVINPKDYERYATNFVELIRFVGDEGEVPMLLAAMIGTAVVVEEVCSVWEDVPAKRRTGGGQRYDWPAHFEQEHRGVALSFDPNKISNESTHLKFIKIQGCDCEGVTFEPEFHRMPKQTMVSRVRETMSETVCGGGVGVHMKDDMDTQQNPDIGIAALKDNFGNDFILPLYVTSKILDSFRKAIVKACGHGSTSVDWANLLFETAKAKAVITCSENGEELMSNAIVYAVECPIGDLGMSKLVHIILQDQHLFQTLSSSRKTEADLQPDTALGKHRDNVEPVGEGMFKRNKDYDDLPQLIAAAKDDIYRTFALLELIDENDDDYEWTIMEVWEHALLKKRPAAGTAAGRESMRGVVDGYKTEYQRQMNLGMWQISDLKLAEVRKHFFDGDDCTPWLMCYLVLHGGPWGSTPAPQSRSQFRTFVGRASYIEGEEVTRCPSGFKLQRTRWTQAAAGELVAVETDESEAEVSDSAGSGGAVGGGGSSGDEMDFEDVESPAKMHARKVQAANDPWST